MTVPYLCLALMNSDPCVFGVIYIVAVITTCKHVLHGKSVSLLVCFFFQIGRIIENSEAVTEILSNVELLKQIVYCIGGENLSVAKVVSLLEHLSRLCEAWCPRVSREGLVVVFVGLR